MLDGGNSLQYWSTNVVGMGAILSKSPRHTLAAIAHLVVIVLIRCHSIFAFGLVLVAVLNISGT